MEGLSSKVAFQNQMPIMQLHGKVNGNNGYAQTQTDIVIFCTDNNYLIRELPAVLFLGFIEGPTCKALLLP